MEKNIFKNAKKLTREELRSVSGGKIIKPPYGDPDLSECGCDCAGRVTGPYYCSYYFGCPQVYTCGSDI